MSGPQTPGPAESPPAAGSGPRVPAAARGVAAAAGDPATPFVLHRRGPGDVAERMTELQLWLMSEKREVERLKAALLDAAFALDRAADGEDELRATIERARTLHRETTSIPGICRGCDRVWPCPTLDALAPPGGGT